MSQTPQKLIRETLLHTKVLPDGVRPIKQAVNLNSAFHYDNRTVIFYYPSCQSVAEELCNEHPEMYRLGAASWLSFGDGTPNMSFEGLRTLNGRDVALISSFRNHAEILVQMFFARVLAKQGVKSMTWIPAFFPHATSERVESEGEIATANPAAELLSMGFPSTRTGPPKLVLYDIHCLSERFFFDPAVHLSLPTATSLLKTCLWKRSMETGERFVVAFPDAGSSKRFGKMFSSEFATVTCSKTRKGSERIIEIINTSMPSKDVSWAHSDDDGSVFHDKDHVVVVDDLLQTGGTSFMCMQELRKMGATKVSLYVTHGVFPQNSFKHFEIGGKFEGFDTIYVTNSLPEMTNQLVGVAPFQVLSLAPLMHKEIQDQVRMGAPERPMAQYVNDVFVASTSGVKMAVANLYFKDCTEPRTIQGISTKSGVNNQPFGYRETYEGAQNRLNTLLREINNNNSNGDYEAIVFENGIYSKINKDTKETEYFDIGCVIYFSTKTARHNVTWTDSVQIPTEAFEKSKLSGFKETAGSFIDPSCPDNWHKSHCGVGREELLINALHAAVVANSQYQ